MQKQTIFLSCLIILFLVTITIVFFTTIPSNGYAKYITLPPILQTANIEGNAVQIVIYPKLEIITKDEGIQLNVNMDGDLGNLQKILPSILNGKKKYNECGESLWVKNTSVRPQPPNLSIESTITYTHWWCVDLKLDKAKGRTVSQSLNTKALIRPFINRNALMLKSDVKSAKPTGIFGKIVNIFDLESEVKRIVQDALRDALNSDNLVLVLPEEIRKYDLVFNSVEFTKQKNGLLGLNIKGSCMLTGEELSDLLNIVF